jgi:hypothetical protein
MADGYPPRTARGRAHGTCVWSGVAAEDRRLTPAGPSPRRRIAPDDGEEGAGPSEPFWEGGARRMMVVFVAVAKNLPRPPEKWENSSDFAHPAGYSLPRVVAKGLAMLCRFSFTAGGEAPP